MTEETEIDKAIRLLKERYMGLENASISPAGNGYYTVGLAMGGMALSDNFQGGKDFIENVEPLYFKLRQMVKQVKAAETKRSGSNDPAGTGILG